VFVPDPERRIAAMIHEGLIVGRVGGAMEYGPRALGNRSILVRPTDRTVNDWLNKRLHRTEFMPFAPAMLAEDGPRVFASVAGLEYAAEFMTVTMDVKPEWHHRAPAVVHIDGTARPQFVTPRSNPKFYAIIREYARLSGLPMLINTSFNIHEEPIICTAEHGVQGLRDGAVDVLAVGDWLVAKNRSLIEERAPAAV
jgi:carbamoyltransferase